MALVAAGQIPIIVKNWDWAHSSEAVGSVEQLSALGRNFPLKMVPSPAFIPVVMYSGMGKFLRTPTQRWLPPKAVAPYYEHPILG